MQAGAREAAAMTAFVLGATGFVGREVVRQLCVRGAQDDRARASRLDASSPSGAARSATLGAEVDTTPWDAAALAARLARARAPAQVYILIGTTRAQGEGRRRRGRHLRGGRPRPDEARRRRRARRRTPSRGSSTCRRVGADREARARRTCARAARPRTSCSGSGLPWVIARPSIITGERDDGRARRAHRRRSSATACSRVAGVFGGKKLRATLPLDHARRARLRADPPRRSARARSRSSTAPTSASASRTAATAGPRRRRPRRRARSARSATSIFAEVLRILQLLGESWSRSRRQADARTRSRRPPAPRSSSRTRSPGLACASTGLRRRARRGLARESHDRRSERLVDRERIRRRDAAREARRPARAGTATPIVAAHDHVDDALASSRPRARRR